MIVPPNYFNHVIPELLDRSWGIPPPPRWDQTRTDIVYGICLFDPIRVRALCVEDPQLWCISLPTGPLGGAGTQLGLWRIRDLNTRARCLILFQFMFDDF